MTKMASSGIVNLFEHVLWQSVSWFKRWTGSHKHKHRYT